MPVWQWSTEPRTRSAKAEPNRTEGSAEPNLRQNLGSPQKVRPLGRTGSASRPNLFGLSGGTQEKEGPNSYRLRSFPTICSTLSGLFWLSVRHHSREREEGRRTCTPSPILPRLPSSLSPCLDSRPYRPREKTPLSEVCSPFGRSRPRPSCRVGGSWPTDSTLVSEFTYTDWHFNWVTWH